MLRESPRGPTRGRWRFLRLTSTPSGKEKAAIVLHCLHGTFQDPGVWAGLADRLAPQVSVPVRVVTERVEPPAQGGLEGWADAFCRQVAVADEAATPGGRVLLGYSLGGRLAMHALLACPGAWGAAVLIAAHPGEADEEKRAAVQARDAAWADRCRSGEAMGRLLAEWDALPVFGGHPNRAPRMTETVDRERCARGFEAFSRAGQADLRPALAAASLPPVLYVTGRDDPRYPALGDELAEIVSELGHESLEGAGHRVPWDRPDEFAKQVGRFLSRVTARRGDSG